MTKTQDTDFQRFVKRYGSPINPDLATHATFFSPNFAFFSGLKRQIKLKPDQHAPHLEFGFCMVKDYPNAVVGRSGDTYCALIYHMYLPALLEVYGILLSHPEIAPSLGDRDRETARPHHRREIAWGFHQWTDNFRHGRTWHDAFTTYAPACPERQSLVVFMTNIALRFLWLHETAHVLDGHLEYQQTVHRRSEMIMHFRDDRTATEIVKKELSILEIAADNLAIQYLLQSILDGGEINYPACMSGAGTDDKLYVHLLALVFLSWYWMGREAQIAFDNGVSESRFGWDSYPSPTGRLIKMVATFRDTVTRIWPGCGSDLQRCLDRLEADVDVVAALGSHYEILRVVKVPDQAAPIFYRPFLISEKFVNDLRDRVRPFSRVL
ncbi:hypothetical protein [Paracoccus sp. (in: a-proteobacteria)]|uniref:hypothetical protein n=1 Tax=Paracoccus sp. TaxID=267 RepID=UPI0032208FCF